jgi:hypothetical protein
LTEIHDARAAETEVFGIEPLDGDRVVAGQREVMNARFSHIRPSPL